jgi:MFS family permease
MILVNLTVGDIFWVNAASFLFVIAALWVIRPQFAQPRGLGRSSDPGESPWRTLTAGVRYAREHSVIGVLILSTAVLTVFGMAYMMIAPAVVDHSLLAAAHGAALLTNSAAWKARQALIDRQTAYLMAANGFGAVLSALVVASLPATVRRERIIPWTLLLLAAALTGFGLSHNLYLTLVMSSIAGAALLTTNSLVNTSIQTRVPGQLRGRVMSLFVMSFMGLMPFAALIFGFLAQAIGPGPAIIGGAVVLFAWGITLISRPRMLCPTG